MNNTITLTDEQIKALQSGQPITIEPPKQVIAKWHPKRGEYLVYGDFYVNSPDVRNKIETATNALRSYARQLAWLAENDDGYIWKNNNHHNYFVYFNIDNNKYCMDWEHGKKVYSTIYMSKANAIKLCKLLNDGIVEF